MAQYSSKYPRIDTICSFWKDFCSMWLCSLGAEDKKQLGDPVIPRLLAVAVGQMTVVAMELLCVIVVDARSCRWLRRNRLARRVLISGF